MTRLNTTERKAARGVHARPSADGRYWDAVMAAIADRDDLLDAIRDVLRTWPGTVPDFGPLNRLRSLVGEE